MPHAPTSRLLDSRGNFVAIDFETADRGHDSACAVGLVRVVDWRIEQRAVALIRPPRREFVFSYLHGITWDHVKDVDNFGLVWRQQLPLLSDAEFLAAHNAEFDQAVLCSCCAGARLAAPALRFECSMALARQVWNIYPTKLPDVCRRLRLSLKHHDAASDAEACARIVIAARHALATKSHSTHQCK